MLIVRNFICYLLQMSSLLFPFHFLLYFSFICLIVPKVFLLPHNTFVFFCIPLSFIDLFMLPFCLTSEVFMFLLLLHYLYFIIWILLVISQQFRFSRVELLSFLLIYPYLSFLNGLYTHHGDTVEFFLRFYPFSTNRNCYSIDE